MENSMEDHCICSVLHNCSPLSRYLKTTLINGKYHFVRTLGKGACGEVILAHNVENREEVAIKIIDTMDIPPSILQMIHNEVDIMKKLDHPNVVKFYDSFHLEETFFIVMEYANGGNLLDFLIKNGPLTEDKARPIFQQVVSAIGHLHDMGIVHHDIKLENLLLDSGNNVKLADFGFSTFDKGQQLDLFCGTPLYMAPELYRGVPYNGEKIDIWALGITLNAILTNCFAFSEDGLNIIAANFTNIEYRPPTTLTSHCRRLLEAMLHYDPQRRWTAHKILKSKWLENPSLSKEPNSIIGSSYIDRNPTLISDPEEEPEITWWETFKNYFCCNKYHHLGIQQQETSSQELITTQS